MNRLPLFFILIILLCFSTTKSQQIFKPFAVDTLIFQTQIIERNDSNLLSVDIIHNGTASINFVHPVEVSQKTSDELLNALLLQAANALNLDGFTAEDEVVDLFDSKVILLHEELVSYFKSKAISKELEDRNTRSAGYLIIKEKYEKSIPYKGTTEVHRYYPSDFEIVVDQNELYIKGSIREVIVEDDGAETYVFNHTVSTPNYPSNLKKPFNRTYWNAYYSVEGERCLCSEVSADFSDCAKGAKKNKGGENDEGDEGDENDEGDEGDENDEGDEVEALYEYSTKCKKKLRIYLSDFLELAPSADGSLSYNVKQASNLSMNSGDSLALFRTSYFEHFNAIAFFDLHSITQSQNNNSLESNDDNTFQIELNAKLPVWDRVNRGGSSYLSKFYASVNFSPLGKSTPYFLISEQIQQDSIPFKSFELFRNHYSNNSLKMSLYKNHIGVERVPFYIELNGGLRHYQTKIREPLSVIKNGDNDTIPDFENFVNTSIIGLETELKFKYTVDDWLGFDLNFGYNYLKVQDGRNNAFLKLREKYGNTNYDNRVHMLYGAVNIYIKPDFNRISLDNRTGFFARYRIYGDVNSNLDVHQQILIGYSANISQMLKK